MSEVPLSGLGRIRQHGLKGSESFWGASAVRGGRVGCRIQEWIRGWEGSGRNRIMFRTFEIYSYGFRVHGPGFGVHCSGFRMQDLEFRVRGSGLRVEGSAKP